MQCVHAKKELDGLHTVVKDSDSQGILEELSDLISKVAGNSAILDLASRIGNVNATFQGLRKAFHLPEKGKLSGDNGGDEISHESCGIFMGQLKALLRSGASIHETDAAMQIIEAYEKWEEYLFAQNKEGTIPRTNNSMEQFFRRIRRNVRKRTGNIATGRLLSLNGDRLAIFQNLGIPDYKKLVFGSASVASKFASYRKGLQKNAMPRKRMLELVDMGKKRLISGTLRNDPFSDEMMEEASAERKAELASGT